jgi:hypothetical protein
LNEPTNVCRVAALSALLGSDARATEGLATELGQMGFSSRLVEQPIGNIDVLATFDEFRYRQQRVREIDRVDYWQRINQSAQPQDVGVLLFAMLGSGLPRESTAAASALWRQVAETTPPPDEVRQQWLQQVMGDGPSFAAPPYEDIDEDPGELSDEKADEWWYSVFQAGVAGSGEQYDERTRLMALLRWRLRQGLRSSDRVTRSLALAAFLPPVPRDEADAPLPEVSPPLAGSTGVEPLSTMVHGTWGWKGAWWRPQGDFYEFILPRAQINLYRGGARYSWSGALSSGQRHLAGAEFHDWANDRAPNGLRAVFAHSYGGEVAARAIVCGTNVQLLVLLSTPVTRHIREALPRVPVVVDVRLPFDPVLALACRRQRIKQTHQNVREVTLARWRLDHGATHNPRVWDQEPALKDLQAQWH